MVKLYLHPFFLTLIATIFLAGCSKTDYDTEKYINLRGDFSMSINEKLQPGENIPILNITMNDEVNCAEAKMQIKLIQDEDNIDITIDGITAPTPCADTLYNISQNVELASLSLDKTPIQLFISDILNISGNITNDRNSYTISLKSHPALDIENAKIWKTADGMVWGRISMQNVNSQDEISQMKNQIHSMFDEESPRVGRYAGFKYINGTLTPYGSFDTNYPYSETFLINVDEDLNSFKDLLKDFRSQYGSELKIHSQTWEGENL